MKLNTIMIIFAMMLAIIVSRDSEGSDPHHDHESSTNTTTILNSRIENTDGIALAIAAAQHQFDWGTYSLQGSIGVGEYDGNNAISFGIGGRIGKDRMLVNGSIGVEEGKTGIGAGLNWRF